MRISTLFLAAIFVFSHTLFADARADFNGAWILNKSESKLPEAKRGPARFAAMELKITQNADSLTIERKLVRRDGQANTVVETLPLNGNEVETKTGRGKKKSTAHWSADGKKIIIESIRQWQGRRGRSFNIKTREILSLSEDGQKLIIETVAETPRGERKVKLIYDKKE